MIAPTLGDFWAAAYGDELRGVFTTSLWGRGTQYNRIYRFLGYTKGFGHEHISDDEYRVMVQRLRLANVTLSSTRFGKDSSNSRMARIMQYRRLTGDKQVTVFHGRQRGVYFRAAEPPSTRSAVIKAWYTRWGRPRFERMKDADPPYFDGLTAAVA
jgi:hypothetical protein